MANFRTAKNVVLYTIGEIIPRVLSFLLLPVLTKYLSTTPSLIIVGKAPAFIDPLKKDFPDVKVIPQSNLDLNRPGLVKEK